jgi:hypothetical protein
MSTVDTVAATFGAGACPSDSAIPGRSAISRRLRSLLRARSFWCLSVVVLMVLTTYRAQAQVVPVLRLPTRFSVFTTFTAAKPHFGYYDDRAVSGLTAGGIMQLPRLGGVEVRGSVLRFGGLSHHESILIGPRVALHIFHVTPYGSLLVGEGNSWWWTNPPGKNKPTPQLDEGRGFQWSVVGGLDVHLHNRLSFRVGELSFSRLYIQGRNMTPLSASSGLVFRVN